MEMARGKRPPEEPEEEECVTGRDRDLGKKVETTEARTFMCQEM